MNPAMGLPNGEVAATIMLLNAMSNTPDHPQSPRLLSLHSCGEGALGVADLIGYNLTED